MEFNNVNKFTYNVKSLSRDITITAVCHNYFKIHLTLYNIIYIYIYIYLILPNQPSRTGE